MTEGRLHARLRMVLRRLLSDHVAHPRQILHIVFLYCLVVNRMIQVDEVLSRLSSRFLNLILLIIY